MWASGLQDEEQECGPDLLQPTAEKVSSLGKDWHKFCLKCERCNKTLTPGGHAEHDGKPFCHKPCYATLFGPKGKQGLSQGLSQLLWLLGWVGVSSYLPLPLPCATPNLESLEAALGGVLCKRWVESRPPIISLLLACLPPSGVNIGGAGSYIYEKPPAEGPQVTGPIEVPVVRTEERKTSGPPKGPSKGEIGSGWG